MAACYMALYSGTIMIPVRRIITSAKPFTPFDKDVNYLWKCVSELDRGGFRPYALSLQHQPEPHEGIKESMGINGIKPSMMLDAHTEAALGIKLRAVLDRTGYRNVKLTAFEHNWNHSNAYPVTVVSTSSL